MRTPTQYICDFCQKRLPTTHSMAIRQKTLDKTDDEVTIFDLCVPCFDKMLQPVLNKSMHPEGRGRR